jgi:uncharacterized membrane protein YfcA
LGALALLVAYSLVVTAAGALVGSLAQERWMLFIPACAAIAIIYMVWVNIYPPQPGAYRIIPWIVLIWCCVSVVATLLGALLVKRITAGFRAARLREE